MSRVNYPITVNQLASLCVKEMAKGNGEKYVLISDDEEGNGYHECYFPFSPAEEFAEPYSTDLDLTECVVLG